MKSIILMILCYHFITPTLSAEDQTQENNSFLSLPDEVILKIFESASYEDLLSLKFVCKRTYALATDKTLLRMITPLNFIPKQTKLCIPSVYSDVQILGSSTQESIQFWNQYPSLTTLSIATTLWPIPQDLITTIASHFPGLEHLYIQIPTTIDNSLANEWDRDSLTIKVCGLDFANSLPFPLARHTAILFGSDLKDILPRLRTLSTDIIEETALVLDLVATKTWRQIGFDKAYDHPEHISYLLHMITAPVGSRSPQILKAKLKLISILAGPDLLTFQSIDLLRDIKNLLHHSRKNGELMLVLLSTVSDIAPHLRVAFIRSASYLTTTSKKLRILLTLLNNDWMTPLYKSFIAFKMFSFMEDHFDDKSNKNIRHQLLSLVSAYIHNLQKDTKRDEMLRPDILRQL